MKSHSNSKDCSESLFRFSVLAFLLSHWSIFSREHVRTGFRNNFIIWFYRSKQKLSFNFLRKEAVKNCEIRQRSCQTNWSDLMLISWHYPFNTWKSRVNRERCVDLVWKKEEHKKGDRWILCMENVTGRFKSTNDGKQSNDFMQGANTSQFMKGIDRSKNK